LGDTRAETVGALKSVERAIPRSIAKSLLDCLRDIVAPAEL
jgi:hypothetical protein